MLWTISHIIMRMIDEELKNSDNQLSTLLINRYICGPKNLEKS